MTTNRHARLSITCGLAVLIAVTTPAAGRGGGGGGGRGGGGYGGGGYSGGGARTGGGYSGGGYSGAAARPAYSGNGSVRYSQPSAPSYSRPPVAAQRPVNTPSVGARPTTPSYVRPSVPVATPLPVARPPNYGSISRGGTGGANYGTVTTPGGSTIGGIKGPGGGGAVGVAGAGGATAGAIRGPGGSTAAGIRGPGGGAAAGIAGPGGGGAAGIQGSGGRSAGAVWGPNGGIVAGARGPYGGFVTGRLPDGAVHYPWGGSDYWHAGYAWYSPCWIGDDAYYAWAYPPVGYYYPELPPDYSTIVIGDSSYYCSEGVYYQEGEKDGQKGYVVAELPEGKEAPKGKDPFKILKSMCDYLDGLKDFRAEANTTSDDVLASGERVQLAARRTIFVSRPDKVAAYVTGDFGEKRLVYNGQTVSMYDRKKNVYTVIAVPDTINGAMDTLANDYGIVVPLEELLYQNAYGRLVAHAAAGQYLGLHRFGSIDCHHLAFATDALDWEIWIEAGDKPLPRKVTISYKQYPGNPRYTAVIAWKESASVASGMFEFTPLSGTQRIDIAPVRATATAPATNASPSEKAGKETP